MLDASVALAWFLPDEKPSARVYALQVLEAIERSGYSAVVPAAWHLEVAAVLLRRLRARSLTEEAFERALRAFEALPLETHKAGIPIGAIVGLARRYHVQAGDAIYFDLAHASRLPLATLDAGLRTAARAHGVTLFEPAAA